MLAQSTVNFLSPDAAVDAFAAYSERSRITALTAVS